MSLEKAIQENTEAIKALTAVWQLLASNATGVAATAKPGDTVIAAGKPIATVADAKPEAKAKVEETKPEAKAKVEETKPEAKDTAAVDYPTVQKAVFALANAKGRDAVVALLKDKFGVESAKALSEEQWPDALAALTEALEG